LQHSYIKLLEIEGKYKWSTLYKKESSDEEIYTWTFGSSFFFVFTLYTTVGYGTIFPGTDAGRLATILYSAFFYPFSLVVIRDLGQLTLVAMTRIYARLLIKIRKARGYLTTEWESISLPLSIIIVVSVIFMAIAGVFFHYYDWYIGPEEGLNSFHSFYFSYLSYTMIGFGDVMPVNVPYSPLFAILICAGLPLMRVVTKSIYVAMENGYFGTMLYVESKLEGKVYATEEKQPEKMQASLSSVVKHFNSHRSIVSSNHVARHDLMQNFTIKSLATFMSSGRDVYNGEYGRVEFRKSDL
ncbi:hypothetical protein PFISCL1PPCAC_12864, partial [Pristionchus fissidentatus]